MKSKYDVEVHAESFVWGLMIDAQKGYGEHARDFIQAVRRELMMQSDNYENRRDGVSEGGGNAIHREA